MSQSLALSKDEFENELTNDHLRQEYISIYNSSNVYFKYLDQKNEVTYFVLRNSRFVFGFKKVR